MYLKGFTFRGFRLTGEEEAGACLRGFGLESVVAPYTNDFKFFHDYREYLAALKAGLPPLVLKSFV